ncbi:4-hydroxy-tetrahydrodipicolinate reductase, partial [Persicitalea sp.]|uniref:4-hydroxy-tetrahydrodipicolinate reductase n=1 Tax=Persicitalea sp. TaxID=3100273 RepID=UPI003593C6B6
MNILLVGYGKMGKAIEQIALERGHTIAGKIDVNNLGEMEALPTEAVDVAIEFSAPEAAYTNIKMCLEKGWPVVSGTTGWLDYRSEIETLTGEKDGAFFYASNYSIGVNLFFQLNRTLARLMEGQGYDLSITEIHHVHKLDAPSGTAITLAEGIQAEREDVKGWSLMPEKKKNYIPIVSKREGEVPGTHVVNYDSEVDTIHISHVAHSRKGFALGAVISAEWLQNKEGVFGMDDMLEN